LSLNYWLLVRRFWKKVKRFIILGLIALLLFAAGNLVKNIVLSQVKKRIQSSFGYSRLYLSLFPPSLIMEDVRSVSTSPFFSAKKVSIKISTRSLLSRDRPFNVIIEEPILRIYSSSSRSTDSSSLYPTLPFVIEKGLIKDGELFYWGEVSRIQSHGIDALFTQRGDDFTLLAEVEENDINLGPGLPQINGRISLILDGRGDELNIKRLRVVGPEGIVKAQGPFSDPFNPQFRLETSYNLKISPVAKLLQLPFEWQGKGAGKGLLSRTDGRLTFHGNMISRDLVLSNTPMGLVQGEIEFIESSGGSVKIEVRKPGKRREYLDIVFDENKLEGAARGVFLDPVANFLTLPWPISSPTWGNFTVQDSRLTADLEFRDELVKIQPDRYPFAGNVHLNWDGLDQVVFSSQDIKSSFADLSLEGQLLIEKNLDIKIQGDVKDGVQTREFISRILDKKFEFPEIRGQGRAEVNIFGDFFVPQVKADLAMSPAGYDQLDAETVVGEIELIKEDFFGRFEVTDPLFQGKISLFSNSEQTRVNIWVDKGQVETILPAFAVDLPISGEAAGHFEYRQKQEAAEYSGSFSGARFDLGGLDLTEVSGKITGDEKSVNFPEIEFQLYQGKVQGRALLNPLAQEYDIDLQGSELEVGELLPGAEGKCSLSIKGRGILGRDILTGSYEINNLLLPPFQPTRAQGDINLGYADNIVQLNLQGNFFPGENSHTISLGIPVDGDSLSGEIKGSFNNIDLLLPWKGALGGINYRVDMTGSLTSPRAIGVIDFTGSVLPFPRFAHAFRDFSGLIFVNNGDFSVRAFQGKFGGGDVKGSGRLILGKEGVEKIDITAEGQDLTLALMERTRVSTDGTVNLIRDKDRFVLEGEFFMNRLSWRREITEKFSFSSSPYAASRREPGFFDDLNLNIRLRADDNAWIENSLGRIRGKFDLSISGNVYNPVLLGEIEALDGSVEFQDRSFKVLEGRASFFNPAAIEPYIHFKGETYVKDYRVTFSIDGLPDRLMPEFNSSPPLPQEDVLALLALGEAFRRTYHYDRSIGQSTASLLSFTLSEEAKKSAERIFSIDRFRIDPFIMGSSAEVTARLTIGKKVSRNFFILYSTNLSTQREEIFRMEWELTNDLSIVGTRDEDGRLSIDVKVHKRFK